MSWLMIYSHFQRSKCSSSVHTCTRPGAWSAQMRRVYLIHSHVSSSVTKASVHKSLTRHWAPHGTRCWSSMRSSCSALWRRLRKILLRLSLRYLTKIVWWVPYDNFFVIQFINVHIRESITSILDTAIYAHMPPSHLHIPSISFTYSSSSSLPQWLCARLW